MLGISVHRRTKLLRTYALVIDLPDEIEAEISKVKPETFNYSLAMRWREKIASAFEVDFSSAVPIDQFRGRYDGETLAHLEWCDDLLRRSLPGRSAPQQSDLERITALVTELERDLSGAPDLDPELRAFLLRHARAMAQAVSDVPVRGTAGLQEALDQALGDIYIRRPHLMEQAEDRSCLLTVILRPGSPLASRW